MPTSSPRRFRFPREARIQASGEFSFLKNEGQRMAKGCLLMNWRKADGASSFHRLGVVTSKRIGGSVVRSRARRLLREAFRRHQHQLTAPTNVILVARNSIVGKSQADVDRDFLNVLHLAKLTTQP